MRIQKPQTDDSLSFVNAKTMWKTLDFETNIYSCGIFWWIIWNNDTSQTNKKKFNVATEVGFVVW